MQYQLNICLLGYSGHGIVVAEALQLLGYQNLFYADHSETTVNPYQMKYSGLESDAEFLWDSFDGFALGIGDNRLRAKTAKEVQKKGKQLISLSHPQAMISMHVQIGKGTFVARGACINPLTIIGEGVIINTSAVVEHGCIIHDFVHIAPSATLTGNVTVLSGAFVGANAVVKQGVTIGTNAVVGAGSVVLNNIPNHSTVAGVPAKPISK